MSVLGIDAALAYFSTVWMKAAKPALEATHDGKQNNARHCRVVNQRQTNEV